MPSTKINVVLQTMLNSNWELREVGELLPELFDSLKYGQPPEESQSFPAIFKCHWEWKVELIMFPSCQCTCVPRCRKVTHGPNKNIAVNEKNIKPMKDRKKASNSVLMDWCLPISFSGDKNKKEIGHTNWQLDFCPSFLQISFFSLCGIRCFLVLHTQLNWNVWEHHSSTCA